MFSIRIFNPHIAQSRNSSIVITLIRKPSCGDILELYEAHPILSHEDKYLFDSSELAKALSYDLFCYLLS